MEQQEKITIIYCRTAQPDPAAIEAQRETLLRYAEAHGFGNVELFEDDGFSGSDAARPAFARVNALIACGRVARVLAQDVARLGRNVADVLSWARMAREQGAEVITLDMDFGSLPRRFAAWLAGPPGEAFTYQVGSSHYTVLRARKNADFDYLYSQSDYKTGSVKRHGTFEYAGIYCRRDGKVYDRQHDIAELIDSTECRGVTYLLSRLEADVREAVEAAIGGDRENLRVKELTDKGKLESLENYQKYSAMSAARAVFLGGKHDGEFSFACCYDPERWTEDSLLEYILDPAGYTAREAAAYIDSHQEAMLYEFLTNDALEAEYTAIVANPRHPAHRVKRIMDAMSATAAKTVRVTICKDDVECTFKAEAADFRRDCDSHYWAWHIQAADRREFERLFGHGDYAPEDILRIEYGRAVIYEAREVGA